MSNLTIINQNGQLLIDSRQVAEMVDKQHAHLLRDIKGYVEILTQSNFGFSDFFIESTYQDSTGRTLPCYLITRKGCDMVANKMTGEKGVLFTAAYVIKFEEMENQLKTPMPELSPQLQLLINLELKQKEHDRAIAETKQELQGTRDVVALNPTQWRKDTTSLINKMALKMGGYDHIRAIREESYTLLEQRFGVQLGIRLTNKRKTLALNGVVKSKIDKVNQLDVIADDKKLIEGYVAIIKEMSIKYGVA